jgi:succinyl-diaminopimelate desuccinylase
MENQKLFSQIDKLRPEATKTLMDLIRIPSIAPENGGEGEQNKANKLMQILKEIGFDTIEKYDAKDERVPTKTRPNIIAYLNGEISNERLWIITHLDIVPPGENSLWTITKPYQPIVKDGKVYGRGSEDNLQSLVSSIYAAKAMKDAGIKPRRTLVLCFVADEEQGSQYGIKHLIHQKLFKSTDLIIVPDGGREDGSFIEIAEKSILWLKVRTIGKQTHASRPELGLNASRIAMQYALALDKTLHTDYPAKDETFDPSGSTFEPTRRDKNVDAVNIVPGEDTSYFDFRVLPRYKLDEVLAKVRKTAAECEKTTGAKIQIEIQQKNPAPKPTDPNSHVVVMLKKAISETLNVKPVIGGIGGGTCAAYFREINIPAVVWSTIYETAHQPNEYSKIDNLIGDSKVYAHIATQQ